MHWSLLYPFIFLEIPKPNFIHRFIDIVTKSYSKNHHGFLQRTPAFWTQQQQVLCCYLLQETRFRGDESLQLAEVMSDLQPFGNAPPLALGKMQDGNAGSMDLRHIMRHVYIYDIQIHMFFIFIYTGIYTHIYIRSYTYIFIFTHLEPLFDLYCCFGQPLKAFCFPNKTRVISFGF